MERLTIYLYDVNDNRHYGISNYDAKTQDIINLVGSYEDSGLTPEEISTLKAERNAAIEEIKQFAGARGMPGICSTCKHQYESSLSDSCVKCDGKNKRGYEWHGLGESHEI